MIGIATSPISTGNSSLAGRLGEPPIGHGGRLGAGLPLSSVRDAPTHLGRTPAAQPGWRSAPQHCPRCLQVPCHPVRQVSPAPPTPMLLMAASAEAVATPRLRVCADSDDEKKGRP